MGAEGLPKDAFVGQTPVIAGPLRHYEILEWLEDKRTAEVKVPWVVLDDMQLGSYAQLKGHFIWVNPNMGLSDEDVGKASSLLQPPQPESVPLTDATDDGHSASVREPQRRGYKGTGLRGYHPSELPGYMAVTCQVCME